MFISYIAFFGILNILSFDNIYSEAHRQLRVAGGIKIHINDAPFMVALEYYGIQICGGSIITKLRIITAAHCLGNDFSIPEGIIRAGSEYHQRSGVLHNIRSIVAHPSWQLNYNDDFDIALVMVKTPLTYNMFIQPIDLAGYVSCGEFCFVYGYGLTKESGGPSYFLHRAPVESISDENCAKAFNISMSMLTPRMLCAGNLADGSDACAFDSGGPLVFEGKLLGLVSWGIGCGHSNFPGVYTYIPPLKNWIYKFINLDYRSKNS